MTPVSSCFSVGFMPAVGSSSRRSWGFVARARAISRRRRFAYESERAGQVVRGSSRSPKSARSSRTRFVASASSATTQAAG